MATPITDSPKFDVTMRVGCSLAYEVTGPAMLLLNLRPTPNRNHAVGVGDPLDFSRRLDNQWIVRTDPEI